jgi:FkbM family methyltransferase
MSAVAALRSYWRTSFAGAAARSLINRLPAGIALPILRGPLRGKRWVVRSSFQSCWFGIYEYENQLRFVASLKPGAVVYDVGANVGFYTLLAAVIAGPGGRVYSFEPLPRNLAILRRHVQLNHLENVEIFDGAVSDSAGTAHFSTQNIPEMGFISSTGDLEVRTFALDELLAAGRLRPPDVIKIDVEGAERDVFEGARKLLAEHRPTIMLATHGPEVHRRCLEFLRGLSYQLAPMDGKPLEHSTEVLATGR